MKLIISMAVLCLGLSWSVPARADVKSASGCDCGGHAPHPPPQGDAGTDAGARLDGSAAGAVLAGIGPWAIAFAVPLILRRRRGEK